jgi:alanyl-tRNA synthetase
MHVVDGKKIYDLAHTNGFPLDCTLAILSENDITVKWDEYFKVALNDNQILENEYKRVKSAILEIYGTEYLKDWEHRAMICLTNLLRSL